MTEPKDNMDLPEAHQIVLDLARQNVVSIFDDAKEHARQMEAIDMVDIHIANEHGNG